MKSSRIWRMKLAGAPPSVPKAKPLPTTMQPVVFPPGYTPFPLPKYDNDFGFGPTRAEHIPDIIKAQKSLHATCVAVEEPQNAPDEVSEAHQAQAGDASDAGQHSVSSQAASVHPPSTTSQARSATVVEYRRASAGSHQVDVIECVKTPQQMIEALEPDQTTKVRAARLNDIAASLSVTRWRIEEIKQLVDTMALRMDMEHPMTFPEGIIATRGLPSFSPDTAIVNAWTDIFDKLEELAVEEDPMLLHREPELMAKILMFLGQAQVFNRKGWYQWLQVNPNMSGSGRLDPHPRMNATTTRRDHCYDLLYHCIHLFNAMNMAEAASPAVCVEIVAGFSALLDGAVPGEVMDPVLKRVSNEKNLLSLPAVVRERFWFVCSMSGVSDEGLEKVCVRDGVIGHFGLLALARCPRFADTVRKEVVVKSVEAAMGLGGATRGVEAEALPSLLIAAAEALASMQNKQEAASTAALLNMDGLLLRCIEQFAEEESDSVTALVAAAAQGLRSRTNHIKSVDNAFIAHSSGVSRHATLIALMRKLETGRDIVLVPLSCLLQLQHQALVAHKPAARTAAQRALTILAYALQQHRNNCILVPFTEELMISHSSLYDEDRTIWNLVFELRRIAPLVKPNTVFRWNHPGRQPHIHLNNKVSLYHLDPQFYYGQYQRGDQSTTFRLKAEAKVVKNFSGASLNRDRPQRTGHHSGVARRLAATFRRTDNMTDKFKTTNRLVRSGHSQGGSDNFLGLGVYTPEFPQVESWD